MRNEQDWVETKFSSDAKGNWFANKAMIPVTSRLITNRIAKVYAQMVTTHARGRLADIGCGNVPLYGMYRSLVDEVTCIDWQGTKHSSTYIDKFVDLNSEFDLGEEVFDTIIATDVIEHLCEPNQFFSSCARALKPNGKMLVAAPFLYWIHEAPHDYHRYTRYGLEYMLQKAELNCVSIEPYGGGPEVLSDMFTKALGLVRPAATVAYYVLNGLLSIGLVKHMSAKSSEMMPLGYVMVAEKNQERRSTY